MLTSAVSAKVQLRVRRRYKDHSPTAGLALTRRRILHAIARAILSGRMLVQSADRLLVRCPTFQSRLLHCKSFRLGENIHLWGARYLSLAQDSYANLNAIRVFRNESFGSHLLH